MSQADQTRPVERAAAPRRVRLLTDRLHDLWMARELLRQFVAKELKVRYRNSALGFAWSMLTPVLMTAVFTVVFSRVIRIEVEDFAAFFLSGYLTWQFFQNSVVNSISSIVENGALIKKVYFPREVLPLAIVLSQLIHFVLALVAVSPFLVWTRGWGILVHLPAVVVGVGLLAVFTAGMAMLLAAINVAFRDLQELIVVIFMVWFYVTPVLYPVAMVRGVDGWLGSVANTVVDWNPMTWLVPFVRDSVYGTVAANPAYDPECVLDCVEQFVSSGPSWPALSLFAGALVIALVTFTLGYWLFHQRARTFAKEV